MTDQLRPFYDNSRALYPLLPQWYEETDHCITPEFDGLNAGGMPIFCVPPGYTLMPDEGAHEAGHAYLALLARAYHNRDFGQEYWAFRGFPGTYSQALLGSQNEPIANTAWQMDPRESWAEAFARSCVPTHNEKTMTYGKDMGPLALRAWFQSLNPASLPPVQKEPALPKKVLWHLSHHSSSRPDGWSGAPEEAVWIRTELTPRVVNACQHLGIELVLVDGDLLDHPEFHDDYLAFVAPHYEANLHSARGWFWGRASASTTGAQDDALGSIFERRYIELIGRTNGPPRRFDWTNVNVTDYYGFRLTTPNTPGILVEHGVGWYIPTDYDWAWLRSHVQEIADVWALTLSEFAGGGTMPLDPVADAAQFRAMFLKVYADIGVAALFDQLKAVQASLTSQDAADTARDTKIATHTHKTGVPEVA